MDLLFQSVLHFPCLTLESRKKRDAIIDEIFDWEIKEHKADDPTDSTDVQEIKVIDKVPDCREKVQFVDLPCSCIGC